MPLQAKKNAKELMTFTLAGGISRCNGGKYQKNSHELKKKRQKRKKSTIALPPL